MSGEENTIKLMESQIDISSSIPFLGYAYEDGVIRHPFPLSCLLNHWYIGSDFYRAVKIGIVQYMLLKTICALLAIIFELFGVLGEGKFEWKYGFLCLGGEENTIKLMESQIDISFSTPFLEYAYEDGVIRHPFPLSCLLNHWYIGSDFYQAVKIGIVQYMLLKTICALLAIIFELFGVFGEGKFEWKYGYPYLAVVLNFSQTWALYCLIQFYSVTKEKLEPIKLLAKFLVFKSIVFLTWWQGVVVAFLFSVGVFIGHLAQELKTRIQDYIICIELK